MQSLAYATHEPVAPTETEALLARETSRLLASHVSTRQDLRVRIMDDEKAGDILSLPASANLCYSMPPVPITFGNCAVQVGPHRDQFLYR